MMNKVEYKSRQKSPSGHHRTTSSGYIFSLWNRLPASIVSAENIQMFRKLSKRVKFLAQCLERPDIYA